MALQLINTLQNFQCDSSDTKPTGVPVGSILYELDTTAVYRFDGTNWNRMQTSSNDASTFARTTIEYEHHEIHGGSSYSCWYEQDVSDVGDKSIIAFKTANTAKYLHIVFSASATAAAEMMVLEAPTITDNTGASLSVFNRRRVTPMNVTTVIDTSTNPDTSGQAMYFTEATMGNVTGGTELAHSHLSSGTGPKPIGGESRATQEWILAPNTLYAFVVSSLTNDDNTHTIELDWYEHTDKA